MNSNIHDKIKGLIKSKILYLSDINQLLDHITSHFFNILWGATLNVKKKIHESVRE